jgi:phosphoribosylformylglycinamidine synthase PurS subunit
MAVGWWRIGAIHFASSIGRPPEPNCTTNLFIPLTTPHSRHWMHANSFARKIFWLAVLPFRTMRWNRFSGQSPLCMKAKIIITPKKAVLDPQGKTVQNALMHMGYHGVSAVHVGKYIEIDLSPGTNKAAAEQALNDASRKFLSNPIIEDYRLEIE